MLGVIIIIKSGALLREGGGGAEGGCEREWRERESILTSIYSTETKTLPRLWHMSNISKRESDASLGSKGVSGKGESLVKKITVRPKSTEATD